MSTPTDDRLFRTYRVVWQFCENRPWDVEKSVDEKKLKTNNTTKT